MKASRTDHADVAHGVACEKVVLKGRCVHLHIQVGVCFSLSDEEILTDLADELSELVQIALPIRSEAELSDAAVKLLCTLKWILQHTHTTEMSVKTERE